MGDLESLPGLGDLSVGASHSLALERVGRQSLALQTSVHGMAARPDSLQSSTLVVTDVVSQSVHNLSQYTAPAFPLPLSRQQCGRGKGTFPPMGVPRHNVSICADPTVNSGIRQDPRLVASRPSASAAVAQTTMVQFSHRTVNSACSASPPPAGELDPPVISHVQPTRLDDFAGELQKAGIL